MINLIALCAEMERSQRHLTPRAARDWWTKGLLPRPQRHGLGRQKGTETFWVESRVIEQAKATYDLLARHSRTYSALIGLWLLGFPIDLKLVRPAWMKLIARNLPRERTRAGNTRLAEAVGELAAKAARGLLRPESPADIQHAATDFISEILFAFYGVDDEPATCGLADLLAATVPYWSKVTPRPMPFDDTHIEWLIVHVRECASLPKQRETLRSATNYEFTRARRVIHVVLGALKRAARRVPPGQSETLEELGRGAAIIFGRAALLPLIVILRGPSGRRIIPTLLRLSHGMKQRLPPP
jgi:hypothetical protein